MLQPIPAIDIIEGKCVRLSKGDYAAKKVYDENPLELAKRFEGLGFKRLHVVDLDGAKSSHIVNFKTLDDIAGKTNLRIDFGGGIKSDDDIKAVFDYGATFATIGSIAVKNPFLFEKWLLTYGTEKLILGADVKNKVISINGWKEDSDVTLFDFLDKYMRKGVKQVLCTDISKDGMLAGASIQLYKEVLEKFPKCDLIASGGVSGIGDLMDLDEAGVPYAVFGKAIYEGRIDLVEVSAKFNT